MNWEAIGSIGEVGGALGVVATLVYLSLQIRQNTRSSRLASFQSSTELLSHINTTIASNDDLADIFSRIYQDAGTVLTPKERLKFNFINLALFRAWETAFFQRREGLALGQSWQRYEQSIRSQLRVQQTKEWWRNNTFGFTDEFREYVDAILEER
jgi:hypothetical protein